MTPDRWNEQFCDTLRLALVPGVGPRIRQALLARFGTSSRALSASRSALGSVRHVGPELAARIASARREIDVEAELEVCRRNGIDVLCEADAEYPQLLRTLPDPPAVLFVAGQLEPRDRLAVAVVGSRCASPYGRNQAKRLAAALARAGLTVVSGLARGIDGAAHRGALEAGGRTLAVLAGGVLDIYPSDHRELARQVAAQGALLSEAPPRKPPASGAFPQRNRIISGLSLGVVVVEASTRSGALITARHAMEQGREVFAVPGRIDCPTARGCHALLRDGAKLVQSVDDVLEELGPPPDPQPSLSAQKPAEAVADAARLDLSDDQRRVLEAVPAESAQIDAVVAASGLPVPAVLAAISALEIKRLVRRVSGNSVARRGGKTTHEHP